MNLGEKIKAELIGKPIKSIQEKKAFLAGILRGAGGIFDNDGEVGLQFYLSDEKVVEYVGELLFAVYNFQVREVSVGADKLNKRDKFSVFVTGEVAFNILKDLEVLVEDGEDLRVNFNFYGELTKKENCLFYFLAGLFVSSGRCTAPDYSKASTGYHLELVFSSEIPAEQTAKILQERDISARVMRRKESFVVYIKSAESIKDFLALIRAYVSVLHITELMVSRGMSNKSNRQKNCDLGNVNKQVEASAKQIEAIKKIEKVKGLTYLSEELLRVARARQENPDETLLELSERLGISKSCLNHRLRKIISISQEI